MQNKWKSVRLAGWLALCLFFVAGCTYPSEVTELAKPSSVTGASEQADVAGENEATGLNEAAEQTGEETINAAELLAQAIEVTDTDEEAQSFWYTGYVKNNIGRRSTTSMYDGIALRPKEAYLVNGRVATRSYQYFHFAGESYVKRGANWFEGDPAEQLPFDPVRGFSDWLPFMENAVKLPDSAVLSTPTDVVQVSLSAREWVEQSPSELFDELRSELDDDETLQHMLDNTVVKMTLWIGKEDAPKQAHYILQYSTWLVMPLPGGGYFDQETFFRFYQHNDPSIEHQLSSPERLKKYLLTGDIVQVD